MGQQYTNGDWGTEERALMRWAVGSTFRARVGRLVFNVSVIAYGKREIKEYLQEV